MFIENLYNIERDVPVLFKGKKALLHPYDGHLYLLHNEDIYDGTEPDDWHRYRGNYSTSFWLLDLTDHAEYDRSVWDILEELEPDTITLGSL